MVSSNLATLMFLVFVVIGWVALMELSFMLGFYILKLFLTMMFGQNTQERLMALFRNSSKKVVKNDFWAQVILFFFWPIFVVCVVLFLMLHVTVHRDAIRSGDYYFQQHLFW
jgi:hypothetical protein